jgi:cytochrome P450
MRRRAYQAVEVMDRNGGNEFDTDKRASTDEPKRASIWSHIYNGNLPIAERQPLRMADEAFALVAAGGETTAKVLTFATFHTLANRETVLPRLREELMSVMPSPTTKPDLHVLEQLPWLVSV